ncbi:hypothetical protein EBR96_09195 [bacterium]|nr:hypothetical protein [bacterium]
MSLTARNFSPTRIHYADGSIESLSPEYTINIRRNFELIGPAALYLQGQYLSAFDVVLPGAGIRIYTPSRLISLSLGYISERGNAGNYKSAITGGISLDLQGVNMHYAYLTTDYVDNQAQHKISMDLKF